ncbi:hypothetical protein H2200_004999 [Cladophialophora chaetospira]|uniref:XPG-I domain-containing protein n=1 Tax=Cladophialophora chaetospira TaxID=386627 RepID=A0AA38XBD2_9EURO|nr:hypothetical protein H2200_004999 [Cladophialophora chaetospira]
MGIPGLFKEIGKGERIALSRLSVVHLEKHDRPLRIAIDAAIWNFQTQHGGVGGKNPALRTLFYRLVKLLALPIHPVFVYDGKNKPLCKRGRTVSRWHGGNISDQASKKLISHFSFPCHVAPGEAEAECAMLQKHGIVDAVMTQDVDAIMFGSRLTLRDWSKEGKTKGNQAPTHVSTFDLEKLKDISRGLDPEGMILVALLSGGDYDEDGVAGIGISLACEIARAGFGSDLLDLVRKRDEEGIAEWRERLQYELESNESGYFKLKRKSVKIPDDFPNRKILDSYMNPAVSPPEELERLERKWTKSWKEHIDVQALRDYAAETLDWQYKPGAWKFVRVLAPALLADRLQRGTATTLVTSVDQITEDRQHFVSDGIPELRVIAVPSEVVGLDLDMEEDSPEYLERLAAQEDNDEAKEDEREDEAPQSSQSPAKRRKAPPWLPWNPEKMWIAEAIVVLGAKDHAARYRQNQWETQNDPRKYATRKCPKKKQEPQKVKKTGGMQAGAIRGYVVSAKTNDKADELVKTSSDLAPTAITNVLAAAEALLVPSPSPPRPKVNVQLRRAVRTPTKQKSIRAQQSISPSMLDYLKSTKAKPLIPSSPGAVSSHQKPVAKLLEVGAEPNNDSDPFVSHGAQAEKHSRPSTSSSTDLVRRITKKSSRTHGKDRQTALTATSPVLPPDMISEGLLLTMPIEPQEKVVAKQERRIRRAVTVQNNTSPRKDHVADKLNNVTQRTPKRRPRKDQGLIESQPSSPSPVKSKRPIGSFFEPYPKSKSEEAPSATMVLIRNGDDLGEVPLELTTGLSTNFSVPAHMLAIPRSSLPGTWKESDGGSTPSSQTVSSGASRPPRVSIIDLTAD